MTDQERENAKLQDLVKNVLPEITKRMREWREEQESTKVVPWYEEEWSIENDTGGWRVMIGDVAFAWVINLTDANRIMSMQKLVKAVKEYMGYNYHYTFEDMKAALREMGEEV